jgi:ankyrin repeat protein
MATKYDSNMELIEMAKKGNLIRISDLLCNGADPNAQDVINRTTPLQNAAAEGHLDVVKLLVQNGADIDLIAGDVPESAIVSAAIAGRLNIVQWLLQNRARVPTSPEIDALLVDLDKWGEHQIADLLRQAQE